jgi:hypothetical protein
MKYYRKADKCGPVPYPDRSGRKLTTEIVSGNEWAPLVALGFVVEVSSDGKNLPASEPAKKAATPALAPIVPIKNKGGRPKKVIQAAAPKAALKSSILDMAIAAESSGPIDNKIVLESAIIASRTPVKEPEKVLVPLEAETNEPSADHANDGSTVGGVDTPPAGSSGD